MFNWSLPKMSGIFMDNVLDPRSQDPNFFGVMHYPVIVINLTPQTGSACTLDYLPRRRDSISVEITGGISSSISCSSSSS